MQMRFIGIFMMLLCLTGCAGGINGAACTNLISGTGGMLQFCQNRDKIEISESGVAQRDGAARVIDDPSTLAALADHLKLNADFKRSRRIVARACVVRNATYVSVKASDLDRLLHSNRLDQSPRSF